MRKHKGRAGLLAALYWATGTVVTASLSPWPFLLQYTMVAVLTAAAVAWDGWRRQCDAVMGGMLGGTLGGVTGAVLVIVMRHWTGHAITDEAMFAMMSAMAGMIGGTLGGWPTDS